MLGIAGIAAPIGFAALVSATSWRTAFLVAGVFPLLGWGVFRPLAPGRDSAGGRRPAPRPGEG